MDVTALIVVDSGCEDACAEEISLWCSSQASIHQNVLSLSCTLEEAVVLAYQLQVARRVMVQMVPTGTSLAEVTGHEPPADLISALVPPGGTFKAEGEMLKLSPNSAIDPDLSNQEITETIGAWLHKSLSWKVDLQRPDTVIGAVCAGEHIWVGVDLVGYPLSKRDWRIHVTRNSLKPTIAAATAVYAGILQDAAVFDPYANDGTLMIEAALLVSRTSPRKYEKRFAFERMPALEGIDWQEWKKAQGARELDVHPLKAFSESMKEMNAIRTNGKLAGVDRVVASTRVPIDWMDTKIEESSIDAMLTSLPTSGRAFPPKRMERFLDNLFNQAAYVLKEEGTFTCIMDKPDEITPHAEKYGFVILSMREVFMGRRKMQIITFKNPHDRQ